jgi:hypothetical protein
MLAVRTTAGDGVGVGVGVGWGLGAGFGVGLLAGADEPGEYGASAEDGWLPLC